MDTTALSALTSSRIPLDMRPESFGELRTSNDLVSQPDALRARIAEAGYLFLRGYLDRTDVLAARAEILQRLAERGALDERYPIDDAVTKPGTTFGLGIKGDTETNEPLHRVLYTGRMMALFNQLLGGPVRHYDFTWLRTVHGGGNGIYPHCDVVYMGRGTFNLYTAWTPYGDVPLDLGGLMVLEGSHRQTDRLQKYLHRDVDTYCTNYPDADEIAAGKKQWQDWDGRLSNNPVSLREKLGGRWLTTNFTAGDVLIFTMATIHASLDNQTNRFRISSDTRYQLASEPIDERWIGQDPVAHGPAGKKGKIC